MVVVAAAAASVHILCGAIEKQAKDCILHDQAPLGECRNLVNVDIADVVTDEVGVADNVNEAD